MAYLDYIDTFLELVPYVSVLDHQPGELQLKFSLSILSGPDLPGIKKLANTLAGINDVRVNLLARTIKITYDPEKIGYRFWESLFELHEHPERKKEVMDRLKETLHRLSR